MKIPFEKDIIEYLKKLHSESGHTGRDAFKNYLIKNKIFYKGITKDIIKILKKCPICNIKHNNIKLSKKEKFKLIIFKKPKERYIADLTTIPYEFNNNNKSIKYANLNSKYK